MLAMSNVEIYANKAGNITIKQENGPCGDDSIHVWITPRQVPIFIEMLKDAAKDCKNVRRARG